MKDQAELLRTRMKQNEHTPPAKTIAIASGKGGVGKSNFSINFALKLIEQKKRVLLIDLDIGMGNVDILLGLTPKYSFVDLFKEELEFNEIIEPGPNSLSYIAGGSGLSQIFQLDDEKFSYFQRQFADLTGIYDYILFDMGAGATNDSLNFISAAHEAFVVTTPEPTSITDGYAMIKHLVKKNPKLPIKVLVNRSLSNENAQQTFNRLQMVVKRFLHVDIESLGTIPDDRAVLKAVNQQLPFVIDQPGSKASKSLDQIVRKYLNGQVQMGQADSFMSKLKRLVFVR
ncbi:MinD/ParA family protein [Halobacillus sp. H74]|uniref:MinD/ParA family protein n=1 Tax=Halobacillus sp. H74 TaxID=3457436 RepID=UPI003FCDE7C6